MTTLVTTGWPELVERYRERQQGRGLARSTLEHDRVALERFVGFLDSRGMPNPQAVSSADVAAYERRLRERPGLNGAPYSPSTIEDLLGCLRRFFEWAADEGWVLLNPCRHLKTKKPPVCLAAIPTPREMELLLWSAFRLDRPWGMRDRAILELFYSLGLRIGECHLLDLGDLDRERWQLTVRFGKGGRFRVLPVSEGLAEVLELYVCQGRPALGPRAEEPALFLASRYARRGRRLARVNYGRIVRTACRRCGLPSYSPHDLRRAFATHLLQAGAGLRAVQIFLGHRCVRSTERYTLLKPADVFAEHRRTHPRARRETS